LIPGSNILFFQFSGFFQFGNPGQGGFLEHGHLPHAFPWLNPDPFHQKRRNENLESLSRRMAFVQTVSGHAASGKAFFSSNPLLN
jgi:hypothetical protein